MSITGQDDRRQRITSRSTGAADPVERGWSASERKWQRRIAQWRGPLPMKTGWNRILNCLMASHRRIQFDVFWHCSLLLDRCRGGLQRGQDLLGPWFAPFEPKASPEAFARKTQLNALTR